MVDLYSTVHVRLFFDTVVELAELVDSRAPRPIFQQPWTVSSSVLTHSRTAIQSVCFRRCNCECDGHYPAALAADVVELAIDKMYPPGGAEAGDAAGEAMGKQSQAAAGPKAHSRWTDISSLIAGGVVEAPETPPKVVETDTVL